ncbi:unnamed protein product, partial [Musa hybrid cultivar]
HKKNHLHGYCLIIRFAPTIGFKKLSIHGRIWLMRYVLLYKTTCSRTNQIS